MEDKLFNISILIKHFEGSLINATDVNVISYVNAFEELSRLFSILGMVFSFVEMDVSEKRKILLNLYEKNKVNYLTIEKMINFECYELNSKGEPVKISPKDKGCRTLLRLHRALAFLIKFIKNIQNYPSDSTVKSFQNAYQETLASHHTWFIRKSVNFASYTIPNRDYLICSIFGKKDVEDKNNFKNTIEKLLKTLNNVYNRVQTIYENQKLLDLP